MEWVSCAKEMPPPCVAVLAYYVGDWRVETPIIRVQFVPAKCRSTYEMPFDEGAEYDEETDKYYWPPGWYEWNEHEEMHWAVDGVVTHWMKLPDAPNAEVSGEPKRSVGESA